MSNKQNDAYFENLEEKKVKDISSWEDEVLKIGGFYKTKVGGWFFVNKYIEKDLIGGRFIYIDASGYDEDIVDVKEEALRKELLDGVCWTGKYHRQKGLYAVWDGANKETLVYLQK